MHILFLYIFKKINFVGADNGNSYEIYFFKNYINFTAAARIIYLIFFFYIFILKKKHLLFIYLWNIKT